MFCKGTVQISVFPSAVQGDKMCIRDRFMLMLIVVIEQIIHTAYTVTTNGNIEISRGRFIRKKVIPISEITTIQRYRSMKFGSFSVTDYILIEYGKDTVSYTHLDVYKRQELKVNQLPLLREDSE